MIPLGLGDDLILLRDSFIPVTITIISPLLNTPTSSSIYDYFVDFCVAPATGSGSDRTAARALPAVARRDQETHRRSHRARVPRALA